MSMCEDGLVYVVQASTGITISNCHLTNHNDVMLFVASDSFPQDEVMQITVAFSHFERGLVQRMPRCRWDFFQVVNNDTHCLMYAIGGSKNPTILSQGNRYIAPPNIAAKVITKRDYAAESEWKNWVWHSEGDLFMNGAVFKPSGGAIPRKLRKGDVIKPKPGSYVRRLTRFAGTLLPPWQALLIAGGPDRTRNLREKIEAEACSFYVRRRVLINIIWMFFPNNNLNFSPLDMYKDSCATTSTFFSGDPFFLLSDDHFFLLFGNRFFLLFGDRFFLLFGDPREESGPSCLGFTVSPGHRGRLGWWWGRWAG